MRRTSSLLLLCSLLLLLAGCQQATSAPPAVARADTPTSLPSPTSTPQLAPPGDCPKLPAAQPGPAPDAAPNLYAHTIDPDRVAALNPGTGAVRWQEEMTGSLVAVAQHVAYATTTDGAIIALNASDGAMRWCAPEGAVLNSPIVEGFLPVVADAQMVYAGGVTGNIVGIDASTGKQVWQAQAQVRGEVTSLAVADGQLYVVSEGYGSGHIFSAFNASDGKRLWQIESDGENDYFAPPVAANGVVYVPKGGRNTPGTLYALDAATGKVRWQVADKEMLAFQTLVLENNVIYTTDPMNVFALNASNGSVRWHVQYPSFDISSGPVLANGVLYIGAANGGDPSGGGCEVDAINASNGARRWKTIPPSLLLASPPASGQRSPGPCSTGVSILGVVGGAVFTSQNRGSVVFNASNGRQFWTSDWAGDVIG